MEIDVKAAAGTLYIYLNGELDEHSAPAARARADAAIDAHASADKVVIDLAGVRFADSAAIGFLLGRYKKLKRYGTPLYVRSVPAAADKVLSVGGLYALIPKI